jgi:hypothetical protein
MSGNNFRDRSLYIADAETHTALEGVCACGFSSPARHRIGRQATRKDGARPVRIDAGSADPPVLQRSRKELINLCFTL